MNQVQFAYRNVTDKFKKSVSSARRQGCDGAGGLNGR